MTDVMADIHARARVAFPERYAPDGTALQFVRGRTWEQKLASWHARSAVDSAPESAVDSAPAEDEREVLEPTAEPALPAAVSASSSAIDDDDPFGGIPEADDDAPYARARGEV